MPAPSSSLATLRPDLAGSFEEFNLAMDRQGYIGTRVLIPVEVMKPSGKFGKITVEALLKERDTARAPGAGYSRGNWQFTDASFVCEEHGAEEPVDDREAQMYAEYFDAETVSAERALHAVLMNQEKRIAALIFNTTTWTGAALTTTVATPWSTFATAVPVDNVLAAKRRVWDGCGLWPNALVLTRRKFQDLQQCAQIVDRVKYSGLYDPLTRGITPALIAQALDLDFILVAGGAKDTAKEGQAATFASIWTDTMAQVARVAISADIREPCVGRVFHWSEDGSTIGGTVESYRDETIRGDVVRVRHDVDEIVTYKEAAHLLQGL